MSFTVTFQPVLKTALIVWSQLECMDLYGQGNEKLVSRYDVCLSCGGEGGDYIEI